MTGPGQPAAGASTPGSRPDPTVIGPVVDTLTRHLSREHPPWRRPALRDAHPKHHLVVAAEFIVDDDVPPRHRHGVLAKPGRRFPAWIRFSNALKVRHDLELDARGMAVKLMGVDGDTQALDDEPRTQDFLAVTHSTFFARTAEDFVDFPATVSDVRSSATLFARTARYFAWPPSRWRGGLALVRSMVWTSSPLVRGYFSQTPYRLGPDQQIKFAMVPRQRATLGAHLRLAGRLVAFWLGSGREGWRNCLRDALVAHLSTREATFDFMIQVRVEGMPLDDAVLPWSERRSPYVKVATIRIPVQAFGPEELEVNRQFGEHLSFTPWHALPDHRPLGSINEARRTVYEAISTHRHGLNGTKRVEPRAGESPREYLDRL